MPAMRALDSRPPRTDAQASDRHRQGGSATSPIMWLGRFALAGAWTPGGLRLPQLPPRAPPPFGSGPRPTAPRAAADHPERPVFLLADRSPPADHLGQLQLERLLRGRHPHHHVEPALQAGADLLQRDMGQPDHDHPQRRRLLPTPVAGASRVRRGEARPPDLSRCHRPEPARGPYPAPGRLSGTPGGRLVLRRRLGRVTYPCLGSARPRRRGSPRSSRDGPAPESPAAHARPGSPLRSTGETIRRRPAPASRRCRATDSRPAHSVTNWASRPPSRLNRVPR